MLEHEVSAMCEKFELHVADGTAMPVAADVLLQTELEFLEFLEIHLMCNHGFRSVRALC